MKRRIVLVSIMSLLGCILLVGCRTEEKNAPADDFAGELVSFRYHPGYSDMRGGYHDESLEKNDNGDWVIVSTNQESLDAPTIVTTYAVSPDDAAAFETFMKENDIPSLENRKDSDVFATDYRPWGYTIVFDHSSAGGSKNQSYSISEYKEYSERDRELLAELGKQFDELYGNVISEVTENDGMDEGNDTEWIGYSYQNHPCVLTDPVTDGELITANYFTVKLDEGSRENYPALEEALAAFHSDEENSLKEEMNSYQNDAIELISNGASVSFEIEKEFYPLRADGMVFSFALMKQTYLGGAHGYVDFAGYHFDPQTGEVINITDVVKDMDSLPDVIVDELEKQNDDLKGYFEDCPTDRENLLNNIPEGLKSGTEGPAWGLDYDGVWFYFHDYSMGSYAAGARSVKISFSDYPDLFTDTYDNYRDQEIPDIDNQAKEDHDAEQNSIHATASMWDYDEEDDTEDDTENGIEDDTENDTEDTGEETIPEYFIYVKSSDGYANLRTGPGTEYDVICPIPNGEALEVYRETATDQNGKTWLKVAYWEGSDNENPWITGWIAEALVE